MLSALDADFDASSVSDVETLRELARVALLKQRRGSLVRTEDFPVIADDITVAPGTDAETAIALRAYAIACALVKRCVCVGAAVAVASSLVSTAVCRCVAQGRCHGAEPRAPRNDGDNGRAGGVCTCNVRLARWLVHLTSLPCHCV